MCLIEMKLRRIDNPRLQNFLWENGAVPVDEDDTGAEYYKETKEFLWLLDRYYIQFKIF